MEFDYRHFDKLLPKYLQDEGKGRLLEALRQFQYNNTSEIRYNGFYEDRLDANWWQGDLICDIRRVEWDAEPKLYEARYGLAIAISNTCDMSDDNKRNLPISAMFAPVVPEEE